MSRKNTESAAAPSDKGGNGRRRKPHKASRKSAALVPVQMEPTFVIVERKVPVPIIETGQKLTQLPPGYARMDDNEREWAAALTQCGDLNLIMELARRSRSMILVQTGLAQDGRKVDNREIGGERMMTYGPRAELMGLAEILYHKVNQPDPATGERQGEGEGE